jgi:hypothetical protein
MARRDQYIKSKTDFVLRKKHAVTNAGTIYENDHMTIVPDDDIFNEEQALFSDSNFKFRIRTDVNGKKKHFGGNWVSPGDSDDDYWVGDNCSSSTITSETKIVLKPNYSSIKDFAYYGSAEKLLEATVRDIALRYPGGICYMGDRAGKIVVNGVSYRTLSNEFDIDIWTNCATAESVNTPMRVLSATYKEYCFGTTDERVKSITIDKPDILCTNSIMSSTKIVSENGDSITIYTYLGDSGEHTLLIEEKNNSRHAFGEPVIRVNERLFEKMYDELDDFEKVLLNRNSTPMFTAAIETPYFDGQGYYFSKRNYTWPSLSDGVYFTPDLSSHSFASYIESLINLAKFHDEHDSDNMWRMLTHTSIKNLDWTFKKEVDGNVEDLTNFDSSRMEAAIRLYGRQFDDIKRYADNIKSVNKITYDEKNNIPDYFLTDSAENDGWDAYNISPINDDTIRTRTLYPDSIFSGYTASDTNISFMRRLALNSDYIQSMKGTRRGIETILGMFGMEKGGDVGGYDIKEYVAIATKFPKVNDMLGYLAYYDKHYYGDDMLAGWPVTEVATNNGTDEDDYIIPWYDKNDTYNKAFYFQCRGGWESMDEKKINIPITSAEKVYPVGDTDIYGETLQYMKYAADIFELTGLTTTNLKDGTLCYVEDITDIYKGYNANSDDAAYLRSLGENSGSAFSHYFILKSHVLSPHVGFVDTDYYSCYGWRNVFVSEFDGSSEITCDGMKVLYLESIKTTFIGNNPHVGYGYYDEGDEYLEHYRHIFMHEVEDEEFSALDEDDDIMNEIKAFGFGKCDLKQDDSKCHIFVDTTDRSVRTLLGRHDGSFDNRLIQTSDETDDDFVENEDFYSILTIPEDGINKKYDESAAFSVINVKNITINFHVGGNTYLKDYIENVVIKYVEQMMPSTAIFRYQFDDGVFIPTPVYYSFENNGGLRQVVAEAVSISDADVKNGHVHATYDLEKDGFEPIIIKK